MIVYFSGTGNSKYCANYLAEALQDEVIDAADFIRNQIAAELITGKPWVFVAPVYAWQMPKVFETFLRTGQFSGETDAWFVLTCGGEMGNAAENVEKLCTDMGLRYRGTLEVVMPDSYLVLFNPPGKEEAECMVDAAKPVLADAAKKIASGISFEEKKVTVIDKRKSDIVNKGFNTYYIKAKKFYATEACVGCGICAEKCVLNNISMQDGKPIWGETCTHCMACINGCPKEAIEYGKKTKGRNRYVCREYQAGECLMP